jgi:predicted phosphodiesterase
MLRSEKKKVEIEDIDIDIQLENKQGKNIVIRKVETSKKWLPVIILGDLHIGHSCCDKTKIFEMIDWINKREVLVIGVGDWLDVETKKSIEKFGLESKGNDNLNEALRFWEYVKNKIGNKLIGFVIGNHEERLIKEARYDIYKGMEGYMGKEGMIKIIVNGIEYIFWVVHGTGKAKTEQGIRRFLEMQIMKAEADVYCCGHFHQKYVRVLPMYKVRGKEMVEGKRVLCCSGSYLRYEDSYFEGQGLLKVNGVVRVDLNGEKFNIHVSI